MVRPHQVNPCTPSRHISLNFFTPATQATYRMCLLTAWCVWLLRSDCKSMRNWWVYEHLSPSLSLVCFLRCFSGYFNDFPLQKTPIFKTKFNPKCLNSSWISYWEVLSAPGVNEEIRKLIIFEETNSSSVSNRSFRLQLLSLLFLL